MAMAQYFSDLNLAYPTPNPTSAPPEMLERGLALVTQGDASREIPPCQQCHGKALTGATPHVPGLLGLPRDYLNAQLGGWRTGQRRAQSPDCMGHIASRLSSQDVTAVTHWPVSYTHLDVYKRQIVEISIKLCSSPRIYWNHNHLI